MTKKTAMPEYFFMCNMLLLETIYSSRFSSREQNLKNKATFFSLFHLTAGHSLYRYSSVALDSNYFMPVIKSMQAISLQSVREMSRIMRKGIKMSEV